MSCLLMTVGCSKDDDGLPPTPPQSFTISNLVFSPQKVAIKLMEPTFTVTGTLNYAHAKDGVTALRLSTSLGFDTTLILKGDAPASSGIITGTFILTRPVSPVQIGFDVSLYDGSGKVSNKLSGTITVEADDSGQSWEHATIGIRSVLNDMLFVNNKFISVSNAGSVGTSSNGTWWHEVAMPASGFMNYPLRSITFTGSQYVAVGDGGTIFTSPDAQNWAERSLPENENFNNFYAVASNGQMLVAAGVNHVPVGRTDIVTSPDGIQWTRNAFSIARSELKSVIWTGSRFVAVGIGRTESNAYPLLLTSADGINWTNQSDDTRQNGYLNDVIQAGNKTIAIGHQVVAVSTNNGGTWTWYSLPENVAVYALCWSGNRLAGAGNGIFTSPDGINWTQTLAGSNLNENYRCIAWGQYKYVAAGKNEMTVSVSP